jgi:threonine/homoserine/homoserine lactone efflux protein
MTPLAFASVWLIHLAAAMSPGPSFVMCVRLAAAEGFRVTAALAVGYGLGAALWAACAMAGLAMLFEVVPGLFQTLKIVGGAFLVWIAFQMWRHAATPMEMGASAAAPRSAASAMRLGFLTFAANPKTAVFFGAVFVGLVPADTPLALRVALIGVIFVNEVAWYLLVARVFSWAPARAAYLRAKAPVDRAFGTLIAIFGAKIALT